MAVQNPPMGSLRVVVGKAAKQPPEQGTGHLKGVLN